MVGMGFSHRTEPRNRKVTDDELARLWRTIDSNEFGATPAMRLILKLAILTGQRNDEVAGAERVGTAHQRRHRQPLLAHPRAPDEA